MNGPVGILSDSHDNMPVLERAVKFFNDNCVKIVMHAGDIVSPFTTRAFGKLECPLIAIFGNNDGDKIHLKQFFSDIGEIYEDPYLGKIDGIKVAMTHKPEIVNSLASQHEVVIYGHTHEVDVRVENALIINPGECCGYLSGKSTVGLLDMKNLNAKIIGL
jgi:uncharacterized protein